MRNVSKVSCFRHPPRGCQLITYVQMLGNLGLSCAPLAVQLDDSTLDVTELPVKKWTQDYKEHLESLLKADEKVLPMLNLAQLSLVEPTVP